MHYFPGRWFILAQYDAFTPGLKKEIFGKYIFSFLQTINRVGSKEFSDFSNVQFVNISGAVKSIDPSGGMITYRPQIQYRFSCLYPMQYLLNNTELNVWVYSVWGLQRTCNVAACHSVLFNACTAHCTVQHRSGVNLAIRDNNGTFLSTLSMHLYQVTACALDRIRQRVLLSFS